MFRVHTDSTWVWPELTGGEADNIPLGIGAGASLADFRRFQDGQPRHRPAKLLFHFAANIGGKVLFGTGT